MVDKMKKTRMSIKLLALMSLLASPIAQSAVGDIIMWPVVTSSELVFIPPDGTRIVATVDMVPIMLNTNRPQLWNDLVLKVVGPGGVNWRTSEAYALYTDTWEVASDKWYKKFGLHTIITYEASNMQWSGGCVAMTMDYEKMNSPAGSWNGIATSPGAPFKCTSVPIYAYRCQIVQSALAIDYGRINATDANGKLASTTFNMDCDGKVTVSISAISGSGGLVPLGTGLSAKLSVDGKPLESNMDVAAGNTTHTLSATLSAVGVNAGAYSNSTALIVNYH